MRGRRPAPSVDDMPTASSDTRSTGRERVDVTVTTRFGFPLDAGYDYIADVRRWPEYWPGLVSVAPGARWSQPGDTVDLTLKLLGRPRELELTLTRIVPYELIAYTSIQRGLPAASHERQFAAAPGGFDYRFLVGFEPRPGLHAPLDRLLLPRAVERAGRRTVETLERRFAERRDLPAHDARSSR
jgi:hypothetical protein